MDWKALLFSNEAIGLYAVIVVFVYRKLAIHFAWSTERWDGMISNAFNLAESANVGGSNAKLKFALNTFAADFKQFYGKDPSPLDLKDAALDFGRKAYEMKVAAAAAPVAAAPVAAAPVVTTTK